MPSSMSPLKLKAQLRCGDDFALGPGKADLLAAIAASGSISAAGRQLGLSYRRAWMLVETMNRCWREPLVTTMHGGSRGGGATLTSLGHKVLFQYRALEATLAVAAEPHIATLISNLRSAEAP